MEVISRFGKETSIAYAAITYPLFYALKTKDCLLHWASGVMQSRALDFNCNISIPMVPFHLQTTPDRWARALSDCERNPLDSFGTKTQFSGAEWTLGYGVFPITNKSVKVLELKAHGSVTTLMSTLICRITQRWPIDNTEKGLDNAEIVCIWDKHPFSQRAIRLQISASVYQRHTFMISAQRKSLKNAGSFVLWALWGPSMFSMQNNAARPGLSGPL